jgi:hypothetical protein
MAIDPEKLRNFLMDAKSYNKEAHDKTGENPSGQKDPYWLGRMAMCNTLLSWVDTGIFEEEE